MQIERRAEAAGPTPAGLPRPACGQPRTREAVPGVRDAGARGMQGRRARRGREGSERA